MFFLSIAFLAIGFVAAMLAVAGVGSELGLVAMLGAIAAVVFGALAPKPVTP
jgi:hypothetical protein